MPWRYSLIVLLMASVLAQAGDWPQWLGPKRDGTTTEKVEPWKDAPKVLWKVTVGEGHSSPIVANGRVFLHVKVAGKDKEELLAFDAVKGTPLWNTQSDRGPFLSLFGIGPRATPIVDGDRVYTFGITGVLTCFDVKEGKVLWSVDTLKKFEAKNIVFGMSASPLIDGDRIMVNVGGKGAGVVAFDKLKGEVVWKALDDPASYSSPILIGDGDKRQAVFLTGKGLVGLDSAKGGELWRQAFADSMSESSSTPLKVDELIVASTIMQGGIAVKLDGSKLAEKPVWEKAELNSYFSTPVMIGKDHMYLVTGTKPFALAVQADLHCVEIATGKGLWKQSKVGKYHAALIPTANNKLLMLDDGGNLILLEPNPKEYKELARSKVCAAETWAHPAIADGRLYIRDPNNLICLQLP
jgi:outer membrane protein assembly factor BamB